jgi:PilZ domain
VAEITGLADRRPRDRSQNGFEMNMKVFLPNPRENPTEGHATKPAQNATEKRRYTRHRYSSEIEIWRGDEYVGDAMSFEISEGGMSAATPKILQVGERVHLCSLLGYQLTGIVKHKTGAMYGFEFVGLTEEQREKIRNKCKALPLFVGLIDV